ncbi:MAG: hypothetical protein IPN05_03215 [Sulfuritalea sp.]|nr:hypothetical protein [Sulfuritalea sp.]
MRFDPYDQLGVVANFEAERPHHDTAYQWFRCDEGVLAWLPLPGNRISMVWSAPEYRSRSAEPRCGRICDRAAEGRRRRKQYALQRS